MSAPSAANRLRTDFLRLNQDPVPYVLARPLPQNILEWHYVVRGPEKTPYEGGLFHGKLIFPRDYPFKPPAIYMITPSGRFKTNTKLCLSISDFHPETWNPAWSVGTILTGLLSFLTENTPTLGSIDASDSRRQQLAGESHSFNLSDRIFCDLFPELAEECKKNVAEAKSLAAAASAASSSSQSSDQSLTHRKDRKNGGTEDAAGDDADALQQNAFFFTHKVMAFGFIWLRSLWRRLGMWQQYWLDRATPWTMARWGLAVALCVAFACRIYFAQGWYIVAYALAIYILNLFLAFLTPKIDPALAALESDSEDGQMGGDMLPTTTADEFRPFMRRLPEFKFWYSTSRATSIALICTCFEAFNIPVFWPILVLYFLVLFTVTMKRQIRHMIKYRYIPFSWGKPRPTTNAHGHSHDANSNHNHSHGPPAVSTNWMASGGQAGPALGMGAASAASGLMPPPPPPPAAVSAYMGYAGPK